MKLRRPADVFFQRPGHQCGGPFLGVFSGPRSALERNSIRLPQSNAKNRICTPVHIIAFKKNGVVSGVAIVSNKVARF